MPKPKAPTPKKAPPRKAGGAATSKLIVATKKRALRTHRARLDELEKLIRRRIATVNESFYDIGVALAEIVDHKLYAAYDYPNVVAFVEGRKLLSASVADRLIAIARNVPREDALKVGQTKAFALIEYANATPAPDSVASLVEDGVIEGKPVRSVSARKIVAATKAERAKHPKDAKERAKAKADGAIEKGLRTWLTAQNLAPIELRVKKKTVRIDLPRPLVEALLGTR